MIILEDGYMHMIINKMLLLGKNDLYFKEFVLKLRDMEENAIYNYGE